MFVHIENNAEKTLIFYVSCHTLCICIYVLSAYCYH